MLGFFPEPYPEETLYSILSRFIDEFQAVTSVVYLEIFRTSSIFWPITGLIACIDNFIGQLPIGHTFSAEYFINNHTLVPYYAPFMSPERASMINLKHVHLIEKPYLRYCPDCIKQDMLLYGEPYWHRVHQCPGVFVCPEHKILLVKTSIPASGKISFLSLAQYLTQLNDSNDIPLSNNIPNNYFNFLLNIATDSQWILSNLQQSQNIYMLRNKMKLLFKSTPWASDKGDRIHPHNLINNFVNYYSDEFLKLISCLTPYERWINLLTQNRNGESYVVPYHYFLIFRFLGQTAESFFISKDFPSRHKQLFGTGPWPCLNKVSNHYKSLKITEIAVKWSNAKRDAFGFFECPFCGYAYTFRSLTPDKITVKKYGRVWDERLLELANDPNRSWNSISKELGVFSKTAQKQLRLITSIKDNHITEQPKKRKYKASTPSDQEIESLRLIWKTNRFNYPNASISELAKMNPAVYSYLQKDDTEWINQNKPPSLRNGSKIDWEARDIMLRKKVEVTVAQILDYELPIRLTASSIFHEMGLLFPHTPYRNKLSQTMSYIESVTESHIDFTIRRLKQSAHNFVVAGLVPTKHALCKQAHVLPSYRPQLEPIINSLHEKIQTSISEHSSALNEAAVTSNHY